jgi:hypothetical protein
MPSASATHSVRKVRRTEVVDRFGIGMGIPFRGRDGVQQ